MAKETTVQASCITDQEVHETDDCHENIPPNSSVSVEASKVKFQDSEKHACSQTNGENNPLSERNSGVKAKSRMSGLQSALTPILKYLNIGKKSPSPEPLTHGNNPPAFFLGNSTSKLTENIQDPKSSRHPGQSSDISWIHDEYLPEITLLDVTCDSTMDLTSNRLAPSDCAPGKPVSARDVTKETEQDLDVNLNSKVSSAVIPVQHLQDEFLPEISLLDVTADLSMQRTRSGSARSNSGPGTPATAKDVVKKPEVPKIGWSSIQPLQRETSLEATCDLSSTGGLKNTMSSSKLARQTMSESGIDQCSMESMSHTLSVNITHTISINEVSAHCEGENSRKTPLDRTQDISMVSVLDSSRPSGENSVTAKDESGAHPVNVTRDISSSSNTTDQCNVSRSSGSVHHDTSSKNVTCELHPEPVKMPDSVETDGTELTASHNTQPSCSGSSQNITVSLNGTFTTVKSFSTSMDSTASTQMSNPQNKTLDLPLSNVGSPAATHTNQTDSSPKNPSKTSSVINANGSSVKANETHDVQNSTYNKSSVQNSSGNIVAAESGTVPTCIQNNTFETKHVNVTITLSDTASSDGHHHTFDKASPPKAAATPKYNNTEVCAPPLSSVHSEKTPDADPDAKRVDPPESTSEAKPSVDGTCEAITGDTKVSSGTALPAAHRLSDGNMEINKPNVFNLDETLDMKSFGRFEVECLMSSTPMLSCKMLNFNTEGDKSKITAVQKKLYEDGPSKPTGPTPSELPPNIICDRKTLFTQPTAKSILPPRPPSHLLKYKAASNLPMKASGLALTRLRTQAEALKSTVLQETREMSTSYNLRPSTTAPGPKKPLSGLRKPQLVGIPSGLQRPATGLRPPLTRSNAPVSAIADKPHGPEAPNPVVKIPQPKKHPLTRSETLPAAKKKKTDAEGPSSNAEASVSSIDAASKVRNAKRLPSLQKPSAAKAQRNDAAVPARTTEATGACDPIRTRSFKQPPASHKGLADAPQGHGCTNCTALEQQLKLKLEEIRSLKEELLKYSEKEDKC